MRHPYITGCVAGAACALYWFHSYNEKQRKRWSEFCYIRGLVIDKISAPMPYQRERAADMLSDKYLTLTETAFIEDCIRMQRIEFFENRVPKVQAPPRFEKLPHCSFTYREGANVLAGRSAWDDGR